MGLKTLFLVSALAANAFMPHSSPAAFERLPAGARAAALCDASHLSDSDVFSWTVNPAALAAYRSVRGGVSVSPGLFGMPELRRMEGAAVVPAWSGGGGMLLRLFGTSLYRETTVGAGFGLPVSDDISIGVRLSLYHLRIAGYGQAAAWGCSAGLRLRIADQLTYGIAFSDLNRPALGRSAERIPRELLTCLEYAPLPSCRIALSLAKGERSPLEAAAGFEYQLAGILTVRGGTNEGLEQFGLGAGAKIGSVMIDYGARFHNQLGITHNVTFTLVLESE